MKNFAKWTGGAIVAFLALCFMFPGAPPPPPELCGAGKELRAAAGGDLTDAQIHRIACDREAAAADMAALDRQQNGK